MEKHLKTLESVLDSLIVHSRADGHMLIEIKYKPDGDGYSGPGMLTRMAIADEIGELIYEHIGKIRHRRKRPNA